MFDSPINKKNLFLTTLVSLIFVIGLYIFSLSDNRTKIVFCDVGQGDAIYIRIKNKIDVLIDAGPDQKILSCLGRHMPFYDKKIELAIISHLQKDHANGYISILKRYTIESVIYSKPSFQKTTIDQLLSLIRDKKVKSIPSISINKITIADSKLSLFNNDRNSAENSNADSLIVLFQENKFKALFTGDATSDVLNKLALQEKIKNVSFFKNIDILKVPHHGSKTGLSSLLLQLANPAIAVISVGKNNPYGHPSKEVLDKLRALKIKTLRTDEKGDIIFKVPSL